MEDYKADTDYLMGMADELVRELLDVDFCLPFKAEWTDNPIVELADSELSATRVWVVDLAERAETIHGVPLEEYELLIVVQKKIGPQENAAEECRDHSLLVNQIARFCRDIELTVENDEAICVKVERERARDFKEYHEKMLFRAEIHTHWRVVRDSAD
jgi:hypothetical protein